MDILRQHLKAERGRLTQLAEALAINPSAISQWEKVPAERVPAVEEATGISRHDLRPDLYGPAPKTKRARAA
jgi:DNA-binding transcriptional regulator YdaS (Cro superfamily)